MTRPSASRPLIISFTAYALILGGLGSLLPALGGLVSIVLAPPALPTFPSQWESIGLIVGIGGFFLVYITYGLWLLLTGIGLRRLRPWARTSTLTLAALSIPLGIGWMLIGRWVAARSETPVSLFVMVGGMQIAIGIIWLWLFTRPHIKAQFQPPATTPSTQREG